MKNISYNQAINLLRNYKAILIDVQLEKDYYKRNLIGSINIPVEEIKNKIESLVKNKNDLIIVYCLSGIRSLAASYILSEMGYTNVFNIQNGIL